MTTRAVRIAELAQIQPRGLSRVQAAVYVGVSPSKFDELVKDRRMPGAKMIDGRSVWDRRSLDTAFEELPDKPPTNSWDDKPQGDEDADQSAGRRRSA